MTQLILHRRQLLKVGIPYWVFINGHPVGFMNSKDAVIQMVAGQYNLGVKIVFRIKKWQFTIGSEEPITLENDSNCHVTISDKERWWNLLFDVDLVLWLICFFVTIPEPWNYLYHILSEGFFALWLIRIWVIRKRYFVFDVKSESTRQEPIE